MAAAQAPARHATNIAALAAYPGFYHQRAIVVVGTVKTNDRGETSVANEEGSSIRIVFKGGAPDGLDEVRGEFVDIGRMKSDDPRVGPDLRTAFHLTEDAPWPKAGELTAILATTVEPASHPPAPSIRAIVLQPSRYLDQKVTIRGQFEGRNLAGDLPDAPGLSRYDFVLRSADAAIWVAHMRPKGKDFDLSLDTRIDTGRWLQVTGSVHEARGLQWIDAEAGTLELTKAEEEPAPEQAAPVRVPAAPAPEVLFSVPTQGETDVSQASNVRIQFSRDLDPSTIQGHVKVSYLDSETVERGEPTTPTASFKTEYRGGNRELIVTFTKPLERFRTLRIELTSDIKGTDGQALKPWTLSFGVGGS
ncbi:MAG: Ig-like domain-containing protein [Betaproteobacteria bacterium]